MTDDFFRNRLDQMIDLRHPLAILANRMPWQEIEASLAQCWARQFKRMRKVIKRQRTIVGRLQREVGRKRSTISQAIQDTLGHTLDKAKRLVTQTGSRKAVDNRAKLYSWHAPEEECISKVKSRNPYDGHTMNEQIEQSAILMQGLGVKPEMVYADLG